MNTAEIVYWEEDGAWSGNLQEFPGYWTQGDTLETLESHLRDLYTDLASDELLGIRRVAEIGVACNEPRSSRASKRLAACWFGMVPSMTGTGRFQPVPCHREIKDRLAQHILSKLECH